MFLLKRGSNESRIWSTRWTKKDWNTAMFCHFNHIKYDSIKSLNVLIPFCNFINIRYSAYSECNRFFILRLLSNNQFVNKLHHIFKRWRNLTSRKNVKFFWRKIFVSSFEIIFIVWNVLFFIRYFINGIILC